MYMHVCFIAPQIIIYVASAKYVYALLIRITGQSYSIMIIAFWKNLYNFMSIFIRITQKTHSTSHSGLMEKVSEGIHCNNVFCGMWQCLLFATLYVVCVCIACG